MKRAIHLKDAKKNGALNGKPETGMALQNEKQ